MFQKFIKKIKKLYKIKIIFDLPKKNNLLLYDEIHSSVLREIIKRDGSCDVCKAFEIPDTKKKTCIRNENSN